MGKHRNRLQIIKSVLSVINDNDGAGKTLIMYKAYLSYNLLNRYLNNLLTAGLVKSDGKKAYFLTSKGRTFLKRFSKYHDYCKLMNEAVGCVKNQESLLLDMCSKTKPFDKK